MFRIAVCDNELHGLSRVAELLIEYQVQKNAAIMFDAFTSITELREAKGIEPYDLLLLDVLMPGFHGVQTVQEIHSTEKNTKIIYLADTQKHVMNNYFGDAYYYLLKPLSKAKLFPILNQIFLEEQRTYLFIEIGVL